MAKGSMKHLDRFAHKMLRHLVAEITKETNNSESCEDKVFNINTKALEIASQMVKASNDKNFKFSKRDALKAINKDTKKARELKDDFDISQKIKDNIKEELNIKEKDIKVIKLDLSTKDSERLSEILSKLKRK